MFKQQISSGFTVLTPLPIMPTPALSTATNLPPAATLAPAKIIDLTQDQTQTIDLGVY